jgi:hypothetical protein
MYTIPAMEFKETAEWIMQETPKDAVFINNAYRFHPAAVAGRMTYLGWPFFVASAGYDVQPREAFIKQFYGARDPNMICQWVRENELDYVSVDGRTIDIAELNPSEDFQFFIDTWAPEYSHPEVAFAVFSQETLCALPD